MSRPVVLALITHYLPGTRSGGPSQSVANLAQRLNDSFEFRIITMNHDLGDRAPYPDVVSDVWTRRDGVAVLYLSPERAPQRLASLLRLTQHDVLYLNSFFARTFSMWPSLLRQFGLAPRTPVVLAPRGEFATSALSIKPGRKSAYLGIASVAANYRDVIWHASSDFEKQDILTVAQRYFGPRLDYYRADRDVGRSGATPTVVVAPDLPTPGGAESAETLLRVKHRGRLRAVFLGRIARMKNLDFGLSAVSRVQGEISLDIYGPVEDVQYWAECRAIISAMPPDKVVTYCGVLDHSQVHSTLASYDLLLLPTLGENYGHVIIEAMLAGVPVLISDRTQWRGLAASNAGWDIPLAETQSYQSVLQVCVDADADAYARWKSGALAYGSRVAQDHGVVQANRELFDLAARSARLKVGP